MKKIITFIITAVVLLLSTITVSAASTVMSAENKTAKHEETVNVDVSITGNTGFKAYGAKISYDTSALELKGFTKGAKSDGLFSGNKNNGVVTFATNQTISGDGILFTAEFKVKTNVGGKYPITVTLDKIGESSTNLMQVTVVNGSVTVDHIHKWGDWEVTKKPSCAQKGTETRVCCECKDKDERDIAKLSHIYGTWSTEKAASCTEKGKEVRICSLCKGKDEREISKIDHTFGGWSEVKKATCEEQGKEKRVCSGCNTEETRMTTKLSHTYGEWSISKNPTSTEAGSKERICSCGHVDVQVIPAGTVIDIEDGNESNTDSNVGDNIDDDSKEPSKDTNTNRGGNTNLWIAIGIALLLILLILLLLLLKRKKEDDDESPTVES